MICSTKTEFLTGLRLALEKNNINDPTDILTDFRQHFDDGEAAGETEAEVCQKLGDVDDIIKQYISEDADIAEKAAAAGTAAKSTARQAADASGFAQDNGTYSAPGGAYAGNTYTGQQQYTGNTYSGQQQQYAGTAPQQPASNADGGKIACAIVLDILIYSWAIPALGGIIIGLFGITIGFIASGVAIFVAGIAAFFGAIGGFVVTGFAPISLFLLGITVTALGGMLVVASIASARGFINIIIAIINQHSNAFVGRKVLHKLGKKEEI